MSFGWSAGDVATLVKLAWTVVRNCKKACGEYDELTQQFTSLWSVINDLKKEKSDAKSLLNRPGTSYWDDLRPSLDGAQQVLRPLNCIVSEYARINRKDTRLGRLWTRAKFGNKELSTLNDLRQKAKYYIGAISAVLNTVAVGSLGRIEDLLREAGLEKLKPTLEDVAGKLAASHEKAGTVLTCYSDDDTAVWKELRRELVKSKIGSSDIISKNKDLILDFVRQLGDQGSLDVLVEESEDSERADDRNRRARSPFLRQNPIEREPENSASMSQPKVKLNTDGADYPEDRKLDSAFVEGFLEGRKKALRNFERNPRSSVAQDKQRRSRGQVHAAGLLVERGAELIKCLLEGCCGGLEDAPVPLNGTYQLILQECWSYIRETLRGPSLQTLEAILTSTITLETCPFANPVHLYISPLYPRGGDPGLSL